MLNRIPRRYVVVFVIILVAKLVGALMVYQSIDLGSSMSFWMEGSRALDWDQNDVLLDGVNDEPRWVYLFLGWDSAWYSSIMLRGYSFSSQSYAFFPLFPLIGWVVYSILGSPLTAIALTSLICGLIAVPIYQHLAERYLGEKAGMVSTLLFFFSPFVFVFSTIVYTEGIFILLTLAAWLSFMGRRTLWAASLGLAAGLTRPNGFLIAAPLLLALYFDRDRRSFRELLLGALPLLSLPIWFIYCGLSLGDFFATLHTTEWSPMVTFSSFLFDKLPNTGFEAFFLDATYDRWPFVLTIWILLALIPVILHRLYYFDKSLAIYSLLYYFSLLAFGAMLSFPRTLGFLFPVWIPIAQVITRNRFSAPFLLFLIAIFYLVSLMLWILFLEGQFIA